MTGSAATDEEYTRRVFESHVGTTAGAHEGEEQCSWCGEWYGPDNFEDGLRCRHCQERDDAEELQAEKSGWNE